jgi:hypothetical protein
MYRWIVFIHIASVLGLLLVHPVTVALSAGSSSR